VKDIMSQYLILLNELEKYDKTMLFKKRILVVSKCDLLDEKQQNKVLKVIDKKIPHVLISSISNTGLLDLKDKIWSILNPKYD